MCGSRSEKNSAPFSSWSVMGFPVQVGTATVRIGVRHRDLFRQLDKLAALLCGVPACAPRLWRGWLHAHPILADVLAKAGPTARQMIDEALKLRLECLVVIAHARHAGVAQLAALCQVEFSHSSAPGPAVAWPRPCVSSRRDRPAPN